MLRACLFSLILILPFSAHAAEEQDIRKTELQSVVVPTFSNEQNLAYLSVQDEAPVTPLCPRFESSISAAERAVNAAPKNYITMME